MPARMLGGVPVKTLGPKGDGFGGVPHRLKKGTSASEDARWCASTLGPKEDGFGGVPYRLEKGTSASEDARRCASKDAGP